MNKRGQALIEFILILPIALMLLFAIIDFGLIFSSKSNLENSSTDIIDFIKNGESLSTINNLYEDIDITLEDKDGYYDVILSKNVKIFNFGLERIIRNPYPIKIERYIPHE